MGNSWRYLIPAIGLPVAVFLSYHHLITHSWCKPGDTTCVVLEGMSFLLVAAIALIIAFIYAMRFLGAVLSRFTRK